MRHITVLRDEAVEALALASDSVVVDATFGSGGHAKRIIEELDERGTYIGLDADPAAVADGLELLKDARPTIHLVNRNFHDLPALLAELEIVAADAILADLGWRIEQFEKGGRGFSFSADEPLLMTYGRPEDYLFTARDIVNDWAAEDIANVLFGYGEERFARRIARAIIEARENDGSIETARELAQVIESAVPAWYRSRPGHPATKTFQALRIAVNDEFLVLEGFIDRAVECLAPGGRLAIITFHSLEDRIVKHTFRSLAKEERANLLTKRPITPTAAEIAKNPRARSAKLRVLERTHDH